MIRRVLLVAIVLWTALCGFALVRGCSRNADAVEAAGSPFERRVREAAGAAGARGVLLTWGVPTGVAALLYVAFGRRRV